MQEQETLTLTRRTARAFLYGSLGTFGIFVLTFLLLPSLLADANAAQQVSVTSGWDPVELSIDPDYGNGSTSDAGHGDVDFATLTPQENRGDSKGTMRVEKKTIGVSSTGKYYSVYLSTSANNTDLVTGLKLDTDSGITIPAIGNGTTTGTWSNPIAFSDAAWGYAVPTKTNVYTTPFSETTYSSNYNTTLGTLGVPLTYDSDSTHYNQGTWAGVPTYEAPQQIWEVSKNDAGFNPATDATYSQFDVYYAVMVDTDILAGTYSNNIVYTAISSAQGIDTASKNISRNKALVAAGDQEILNFDLAASLSGDENNTVLTRDDFHVFLVPHTVTASTGSNYTVNSTMINAVSSDGGRTIKTNPDYNECTIGSNAEDFAIGTSGAVIKCTMPVSAGGIENGTWNGSYDFWVYVPRYNISYISKYTRGDAEVATVTYAGLQSNNPENGGSSKIITAMQDMIPSVCKNTNIWGQGVGINAKVYPYDTLDLSTTTEATPLASVAHDNDYLMNTGSFLLTDARGDNKDYLIRRLADGNCWMVQNLDLDLASVGTLTADNTDLNSKNTWNPVTGLSTVNGEYDTQTQYASGLQRGSNNYWGSRYNEYIDNDTKEYISNFDPTTTGGSLITSDKDASDKFANRSFYPNGTRNDTATANGSLIIENNSRTQFPRSYDNGATAMIALYRTGNGTAGNIPTIYNKPWESSAVAFTTQSQVTADNNSYYSNNGTVTHNATNTEKYTTKYIDGSDIPATDGLTTMTDWLDYSPTRDSSKYGTMYIGDYYNWYAATAQSGTFAMDSTSYVAEDSICPKGWQLPVDGGSGTDRSWAKLLYGSYKTQEGNTMASNWQTARDMHLSPLSIPFSGNYNWVNGNLNARGYDGNFWSATAGSYPYARNLGFNSTSVNPQDRSNKANGFTVRCVARAES